VRVDRRLVAELQAPLPAMRVDREELRGSLIFAGSNARVIPLPLT
jgi:hypothetical protein